MSWIVNAHKSQNIPMPDLYQENRIQIPGTVLDGVILLQKGFVKLVNSPMTLNINKPPLTGTHVVCN